MKLQTGLTDTFTGIYYDCPDGSLTGAFFQFETGGKWIFRQYAFAELRADRDVREVLSLGPKVERSLFKNTEQYRLTLRGTIIDYISEANLLYVKERWIIRVDDVISVQKK